MITYTHRNGETTGLEDLLHVATSKDWAMSNHIVSNPFVPVGSDAVQSASTGGLNIVLLCSEVEPDEIALASILQELVAEISQAQPVDDWPQALRRL